MFNFGVRRRQIKALRELASCDFGPQWDDERLRRLITELGRLPEELEDELCDTFDQVTLSVPAARQQPARSGA